MQQVQESSEVVQFLNTIIAIESIQKLKREDTKR